MEGGVWDSQFCSGVLMASMPGREFKSEQNRVCLFFMASMPGRRGLRACTARNPNFNLYRPHEACIMAYSGSARDVRRQMYCEGERGEEEGKKKKEICMWAAGKFG